MRMLKPKQGSINVGKYQALFLGIVVLFILVGALWPVATEAGQSLNDSIGVAQPTIGAYFLPSGIVFKLVAIGLFIAVITVAIGGMKKK